VDIVRVLGYQLNHRGEKQMLSAEEGDDSFDETGGLFPSVLGRPWAGGTDTLHSMIYYECFNRNFFKEHNLNTPQRERTASDAEQMLEAVVTVQGRLADAPFDISKIIEGRGELLNYLNKLNEATVASTWEDFQQWQKNVPVVDREQKKLCWIIQENKCIRVPDLVYVVLQQAFASQVKVRSLISGFNALIQERLIEHLLWLHNKGYIIVDQVKKETPRYEPQAVAC
jgi:hypothetical protein